MIPHVRGRGAGRSAETTNWISILMRKIGKFVKPKFCSSLIEPLSPSLSFLALMNSLSPPSSVHDATAGHKLCGERWRAGPVYTPPV